MHVVKILEKRRNALKITIFNKKTKNFHEGKVEDLEMLPNIIESLYGLLHLRGCSGINCRISMQFEHYPDPFLKGS